MAMANSNGGKTTGKKLTKDQAKLAQVVQRIGAVDRKPAKATSSTSKKMSDVKKPTRAAAKSDTKIPAKKSSASSPTVKEHQKNLAEMSGRTASNKVLAAARKAGGNKLPLDKAGMAYGAANDKARKSFGLKTQGSKGSKY